MRTTLAALLLCAVALISLPASWSAQQKDQDDLELEETYHYVPPSARQSVEIGNFYFRRKKYRGALSRYQEAARDDADYAPAYLGMGKVYERTGRKREAVAAYHKYLDALPSLKQAEDAKSVHRAIRRLERQLVRERKQAGTAGRSPAASKK